MFHGKKYLIVSLVFSHLGFCSGSLFLIAPFPDLCLLVPYSLVFVYKKLSSVFEFPLSRFSIITDIIKIHLFVCDDSLTSKRFTTRTEQLTKCCDLHRRAAYSICESWFLIHQDVYRDLFFFCS